MKNKKIYQGITLILLGIAFLLSNMNVFRKDLIDAVFELWPLILIFLGINLLAKEKEWVKAVSFLLFWVIVFAYAIYGGSLYFNFI